MIKNKPRFIALLIFHLIFAFIFFVNFPFDKYLIGWDALNPEFNFSLNFRRVFNAFWQENQGLGLLGGHGFAATLPHNLITFILSLFIPQKAIRPVFTFLCLYLGGLGMYFLSQKVLEKICQRKNFEILKNFIYPSSLFASLFYILNLGTLQMFYVQLEAFIFHFAALPWLFYCVITLLLGKRSSKNLIVFFLISFFSSGQGFIPPLFIAYCFALGIFLLIFLKRQRFSLSSIKKAILIVTITLAANAYWLMPLGYYTITRSRVYLNSYNNLMSTPEFINRNRKYGNLKNVALIKGFIFENIHSARDSQIDYVFEAWVKHHQKSFVPIAGYLLFALSVFGLISALKLFRNYLNFAFAGIFLFFFTGLTTDFFPVSLITAFLQEIPIYKQAFRAAFTKFSLGVAFSYSLFIGIGSLGLVWVILKFFKPQKKIAYFVNFVFFLLLFFYTLPYFQGNFLYKRLILDLPKAYLEIFDFFKDKENARIADFPQDCSEGWFNYNWGYTGSGFYWYGITQPILARTFDVWSSDNENYYWEVVQAAREKNYHKIDSLFDKYDVKWVLYDPNVVHCRHPKAFFHLEDFRKYLETSPKYRLVKTFASEEILPIKIYENSKDNSNSFVSLKTNLLNIGPKYSWNDDDSAYFENGDFITNESEDYNLYYPFRSLFTKRKSQEKEFEIDSSEEWLVFQNKLPKELEGYLLKIEPFENLEKILPIELEFKKRLVDEYEVYLQYIAPEIYLDGKNLTDKVNQKRIGGFKVDEFESIKLFINGIEFETPQDNNSLKTIFSLNLNNEIVILNQKGKELLKWNGNSDPLFKKLISQSWELKIPPYQEGKLEMRIPKIIDDKTQGIKKTSNFSALKPQPCNELKPSNRNKHELLSEKGQEFIRLKSQDSRQCLTFNFDKLNNSSGYLIETETRKISGNNFLLYVSNKKRVHYLDVAFYENKNIFKKDYFILPPGFEHELGYDIYFDNFSQNNQKTINDFARFSLWQIPYNYLKSIKLYSPDYQIISNKTEADQSKILSVSHPNETFYNLKLRTDDNKNRNENYLVLSQTFDPGWIAFYFDGLKPVFLKNHVLVNNWANGWLLNQSTISNQQLAIRVFYWPQVLEYLGFLVMGLTFVFVIKSKSTTL